MPKAIKRRVPDSEQIRCARLEGKLLKSKRRYRLIDLFAGAGGMTLGFTEEFGHPFEPVWANDIDEFAAATYNENFGEHCIAEDIVDLLASGRLRLPKADAVIGGPPCQGFSLLNKFRDNDIRKHLWRPFLQVVEMSGARVFVMENVPQLIDSPEHRAIELEAAKMGFKLAPAILCAADYGVAQTRWRAFILGCRTCDPGKAFPPKRTHRSPNNGTGRAQFSTNGEYIDNPAPWRTVWDEISNLPPPVGTEIRPVEPPLNLHFGRNPTPMSVRRYKAIPEEGMNRFNLQQRAPELTPGCWIRKTSGGTDLFGRLWWRKPAVTIRTEFFKPEKGRYLHPAQHRPITHREAARFQSFPDSFQFVGSKIEIAKQIGNAVPPRLAASVADCVVALLVR